MNNKIFNEQLKKASERGLILDKRVERSSINGVFGLFAKADIPPGTILISYPVNKGITNLSDDIYPADTAKPIKNIHKAVLEFSKGKDSEFYCHFMQFESLESFKKSSSYFYTDEEIALLKNMNTMLHTSIMEVNELTRDRVNFISKLEPSIDKDVILQVCLNYSSRAWDDSNFLPIIDYANHSDRLGNVRSTQDGKYVLTAKVNYKKGDQIYLSYSRKDMFLHAISYNYFDPNGVHCIQFGARFTQSAISDIAKTMLKYTASKFEIKINQQGSDILYRCMDKHACLLESAPSLSLIEYIRANYFPTMDEWNNKRCSDLSLSKRLLGIVDILLVENKINQFDLKDVPEKLQRFYYLLKKEQQMLLRNREWIVDNFYL